MQSFASIVLAAGKGMRMKSKVAKPLHLMNGKRIIEWVFDSVISCDIQENYVVISEQSDGIIDVLKDKAKYIMQVEQLGTGHALMTAMYHLKEIAKNVIVICGDIPLLTSNNLRNLMDTHISEGNKASLLTTKIDYPQGYGRILKDELGNFAGIIQEVDADSEQMKLNEVDAGVYCFDVDELIKSMRYITNTNIKGEYYLTDFIGIMNNNSCKVGMCLADNPENVMCVNDRFQLAQVSRINRMRILEKLMRSGVTIIDPSNTYIDDTVVIGADTIIYPNTFIEGNTTIGEDCIIGPSARIFDSIIEASVKIIDSTVRESEVGKGTTVGPYANLRPNNKIGMNVKIGDFVEIKESFIDAGTKISHHAYIGNTDIGKKVNIGCGTITVNYDGKYRHKTVIGDNTFVGCNTNLVAPVDVGSGVYIAAGSTITDSIPDKSFSIARERQINKFGWKRKNSY